jgi:hypothetical protein
MTNTALYITWQEDGMTDIHQEYIGGGEYKTVGTRQPITKRARWSSEDTPELRAKAKRYIAENMQDDRRNIRIIAVTE